MRQCFMTELNAQNISTRQTYDLTLIVRAWVASMHVLEDCIERL